jgi:CRISPR/Cas system-associated endonuclease Cas1
VNAKLYSPASHNLQCIVIANAGFVTTDAVAWLTREHVALFVVRHGEFMALVSHAAGRLARGELALRRRQMECVFDPARRLAAACALVSAKIVTLKLAPAIEAEAIRKLTSARSIEGVMTLEAACAGVYWRQRRGQEIEFAGKAPDDWKTFAARPRSWRTGRLGETGKQFSNRFALHPGNTLLNYSGAVIVAQCARALAGLGLDVAFGVLHSARPGMSALAWDTFELLRVRLDAAVFEFAGARVFQANEFKIVREPKPHLMFDPRLGRDLAAHVLRRVPFRDVVKVCREVAALF